MWKLPGPGIEPVSPTLAGRCITTDLLGKSKILILLNLLRLDLGANISPVLVNVLCALEKTVFCICSMQYFRSINSWGLPWGLSG